MSQRQQLERIFHIDRLIRQGGYPTVDDFIQELEVKRRAIFMDLQFMKDRLHAPIGHDRRKGGYYYTQSTWSLPSMQLGEGELLALVLGVEAARHSLGTSLEAPLRSALDKIEQNLQGPITINLQSLRDHCSFARPGALEPAAGVLQEVTEGLRRQQQLRLSYRAAGQPRPTERDVEPYLLHHAAGEWYLLAFDTIRRGLRTFHLGRIEGCRLLPRRFERLLEFDVAQWRASLFIAESCDELIEVEIAFDAYQATYMRERRCHETQQIEEQPDGGLVLRFRTGGWGDVIRFVLQYGSHAEVLGPPELRAEVARQARLMAGLYRVSKKPLPSP